MDHLDVLVFTRIVYPHSYSFNLFVDGIRHTIKDNKLISHHTTIIQWSYIILLSYKSRCVVCIAQLIIFRFASPRFNKCNRLVHRWPTSHASVISGTSMTYIARFIAYLVIQSISDGYLQTEQRHDSKCGELLTPLKYNYTIVVHCKLKIIDEFYCSVVQYLNMNRKLLCSWKYWYRLLRWFNILT